MGRCFLIQTGLKPSFMKESANMCTTQKNQPVPIHRHCMRVMWKILQAISSWGTNSRGRNNFPEKWKVGFVGYSFKIKDLPCFWLENRKFHMIETLLSGSIKSITKNQSTGNSFKMKYKITKRSQERRNWIKHMNVTDSNVKLRTGIRTQITTTKYIKERQGN